MGALETKTRDGDFRVIRNFEVRGVEPKTKMSDLVPCCYEMALICPFAKEKFVEAVLSCLIDFNSRKRRRMRTTAG
jgi:hypothetical protein